MGYHLPFFDRRRTWPEVPGCLMTWRGARHGGALSKPFLSTELVSPELRTPRASAWCTHILFSSVKCSISNQSKRGSSTRNPLTHQTQCPWMGCKCWFTWNINQSLADIQEGCLSFCFFYSVHQSEEMGGRQEEQRA